MSGIEPERIETAGASDVGRVRAANQDAIAEFRGGQPALCMLTVADGMGGHRGGEVASRLAVETVVDQLASGASGTGDPESALRVAFETANERVYRAGSRDSNLLGMGTTLVSLVFDASGAAWVAHVGDSRAYRLHRGRFEQLTPDHSVVWELVRRGRISAEDARVHPQRNELLRAIGTQDRVKVDVQPVAAKPGDRFLLCSDGLSSMLPDDEIASILAEHAPQAAVRALIDRANEAGGLDNVSVQIAHVPAARRAPPGGWLPWLALVAAAAAGLALWATT